MLLNDHSDDTVGYGKSPKHTRFQKGNSGNPKGRPKSALTGLPPMLKECLREINRTITLQENGRRRKIPKRIAILIQLINKAVTGDMSAIKALLPLWQIIEKEYQAQLAKQTAPFEHLSDEDLELLIKGELIPLFEKWKRESKG